MESPIFKLIFLALVVVLPAILKSREEARKKRDAQGSAQAPSTRPTSENAGGKSLAEWIEDLRQESGQAPKRTVEPKQAAPARPIFMAEEEEVVVHHQHHETIRPSGQLPHETIHAQKETEHTFQQSIRPSVVVDEEDDEVPVKRGSARGKGGVLKEGQGPTRKRPETDAQVARVQPRYESEHSEAADEFETRTTKARRAQRAQRASRNGLRDGAGGRSLEFSTEAMRRAFIMKEVLDLPIALREQGRSKS